MATVEFLDGLDGGEADIGVHVCDGSLSEHGSHTDVLLGETWQRFGNRSSHLCVFVVQGPRDQIPNNVGFFRDNGADHFCSTSAKMGIGFQEKGINMVSHNIGPGLGERLQSFPGRLTAVLVGRTQLIFQGGTDTRWEGGCRSAQGGACGFLHGSMFVVKQHRQPIKQFIGTANSKFWKDVQGGDSNVGVIIFKREKEELVCRSNHVFGHMAQATHTVFAGHRHRGGLPTNASLGERAFRQRHDVIGMKRHPRAFEGLIRSIERNGFGHLNWLARPWVSCDVLLRHRCPFWAHTSLHQELMQVKATKRINKKWEWRLIDQTEDKPLCFLFLPSSPHPQGMETI